MFKNKKLILVSLLLLLTLSLTACGGKEELYQGTAIINLPKEGNLDDNPVYGFNQILVNALFDKDDKIVDLYIDQLDVSSEETSSEAPVFSGFPEQSGKDIGDLETEVSNWKTKRQLGESYKLESGTWLEQMEAFEDIFKGKTVQEVIEWSNKYCSDITGKPLTKDSEHEVDVEKFESLDKNEKEELEDLTSKATISLKNPNHGNLLIGIKYAFDNKEKVEVDAESIGLGFLATMGDEFEEIYNFNEIFVNTTFNKEDRIESIKIDQLQVSSGNVEDENASVFPGYPGQTLEDQELTEADLSSSITNWRTKKQLGDKYKLDSGTWEEQISKIEEALVGKNKEEVEEWAKEYKSDEDLVSGASISLEGKNGEIIKAILNSFENKKDIK